MEKFQKRLSKIELEWRFFAGAYIDGCGSFNCLMNGGKLWSRLVSDLVCM